MELAGGYKWRINEDLKRKLEKSELENVKFIPMMISYPMKRKGGQKMI